MLVHSRWVGCLIIALIGWAISILLPSPFSTIGYIVLVIFGILAIVFFILWLLGHRDRHGGRGPLV